MPTRNWVILGVLPEGVNGFNCQEFTFNGRALKPPLGLSGGEKYFETGKVARDKARSEL